MGNKRYPIHQSPLFKLPTRRRLAELLRVSESDLSELQSNEHFRVFDDNGREIQEPVHRLRKVHDRLQFFFSRLQPPEYLHSGVKGRSAISNAHIHVSCSYLIKSDITGFFSHSRKHDVRNMFLRGFQCPPDVSHILAELICYKEIVPTGSPLSQSVAFWSHKKMFDQIRDVSVENSATFSLYVDDMIISSNTLIDLGLVAQLKNVLQKHGFSIKNRKTKKYGKNNYKVVTGCVISPNNRLLVKNEHKKKAITLLHDPARTMSLLGTISYCCAIEEGFLSSTETRLRRQLANASRKATAQNST